MDDVLSVDSVTVSYGKAVAVREATLRVHKGEVVALLGPNGAGKTTVLRAIIGFEPILSGAVEYMGISLGGESVEARVRQGIALVPEGRGVLGSMSVAENLRIGWLTAKKRRGTGGFDLDAAFDLFPWMGDRRSQQAGTLSGGEQQMLVIARALLAQPSLLLLDEPSFGLAPLIVEEIFDIIESLHTQGMTILLSEQNAHQALEVADRAYVMDVGTVIDGGAVEELRDGRDIEALYLGNQENRPDG